MGREIMGTFIILNLRTFIYQKQLEKPEKRGCCNLGNKIERPGNKIIQIISTNQ